MSVRFRHQKCKQLGLRVVEAKCLHFVGDHHPPLSKIRSIFTSAVPERLRIPVLNAAQAGSRADSYWRLTRKGAALLRKLNAAHTRIVINR